MQRFALICFGYFHSQNYKKIFNYNPFAGSISTSLFFVISILFQLSDYSIKVTLIL